MPKEKHVMTMIQSDGRMIGLLLCSFCESSERVRKAEDCPYYEEQYEGITCPGFRRCKDDMARLKDAFGRKCNER